MLTDYHNDIENAVKVLRKGGIIVYPTDTIWGIGCDATNEKAVQKIFKLKLRAQSRSMIILLDTVEKLNEYMDHVPEIALGLIQKVETPITIIYKSARNLAKKVYASDGTIAIRIVRNYPFCEDLCREFGKPLVSTSANISGYSFPMVFRDIDQRIIQKADYVVEYGRNEIRQVKPSTIIRLKNNWEYEIIRT
jgi:L-threonylcarbamoyladenylate synthase